MNNKDLIPTGPCCFDREHRCPFFVLKTMTQSEFEKVYPGEIFCNITLEYCKYLKEYLSEQDAIKDCSINID